MKSKKSNRLKTLFFKGFILVFLGLVSLNDVNSQTQSSPEKLRVLFVGNSLTYANNLPEIVNGLARSAKKKLTYRMVAYPNFSLEDHWNKGEVQKILAKEKWDYVVMQQGPSSQMDGRVVLLEYAKKFADLIAKAGAKPAFYMVWSSADRLKDFAGVYQNYKDAAQENNGLFLPAGEAWIEVWKKDPKIDLYSADRFHPSPAGSYLAALVIFQQLFRQSPLGLSSRIRLNFEQEIDIPDRQAKILQQAAAEINKKYGY